MGPSSAPPAPTSKTPSARAPEPQALRSSLSGPVLTRPLPAPPPPPAPPAAIPGPPPTSSAPSSGPGAPCRRGGAGVRAPAPGLGRDRVTSDIDIRHGARERGAPRRGAVPSAMLPATTFYGKSVGESGGGGAKAGAAERLGTASKRGAEPGSLHRRAHASRASGKGTDGSVSRECSVAVECSQGSSCVYMLHAL